MLANIRQFIRDHRYVIFVVGYVLISTAIIVGFIEFRYAGNSLNEAIFLLFAQNTIFAVNYLIILSLALIYLGLVGNAIVSQHLLAATSIVIMFVNEAKFASRGAPLLPEDFMMAGNAGNLTDMVNIWLLVGNLIAAVAVVAIAIPISRWAKKRLGAKEIPRKSSLISRLVLFIVGCAGIYGISLLVMSNGSREQTIPYLKMTLINWNQKLNYDSNSFAAGFIYNIRSSEMKEPDGYSQQKIEEIVKRYRDVAEKKNVGKKTMAEQDIDLIYVMNESFSDPTELTADYPFSGGDPIPYTRSIMKENTSGRVYSPMYGGGTADVEFEAMTGFSTYYLDMMPYPSSVARLPDFPSTANTLRKLGYQTTAIHPYEGSMYKRNFVYSNIGIQNFIDQTTMKFRDTVPSSRYISDDSAYKQITDTLESSDKNKFVLLVSMQNHMPYDIKIDNPQFVSSASYTSVTSDEQTNYLASINHSDKALESFIKVINGRKKKTVLVLWGDHRPGIYNDLEETPENIALRYETPLLIYANFPVEKKDVGAISPNYLTNTVFEIVNSKLTPMQYMLDEIRSLNPQLTKNNNANIKDSDLMHDYKLIEYDIISGKRYSQDLGFFNL
ncbi:MAG: LTA synthase family protein [Candidatus Saccharimonadaceae bacterium]